MKMRSTAPMWAAKVGYIVMSVVFCAAGVLFIAWPQVQAKVIGVILGAAMIVFGCVRLVGWLSKDLFRLAFQFDLELGVLMLVLGIAALVNPDGVMDFICVSSGIAILLDGLFRVRIAFDARRFGIGSWRLILALAVFACLVGAALIFDCVNGARLLRLLLGASLLCEGLLSLCTALTTVAIVKNQMPDTVEADYTIIDGKDR